MAYLRRLSREDPRVKVLGFSRNFGHEAAMIAGIDHAAGDGQRGGDSHVGMVSGIEKQRRLPVQFLEPVFKHLVMFLAAREQAGCR